MTAGPSDIRFLALPIGANVQAWGYLPQKNWLKDKIVRLVGHPHPYGRVRAENVLKYIKPGLKTLDVGCGEGVFVRELALRGLSVTGLDIDPKAVSQASSHQKVLNVKYETKVGDAQNLPFADATFEQVISTDVLEHVPNPVQALKEMRRVLKPGCQLVASVPTPYYLTKSILHYDFTEHLKNIGHLHAGWFLEDFKKMFTEAGFEILEYRYYGHGPLRLLMEIAFIQMGAKNISEVRHGLYTLKWSTLLQFAVILPIVWMDKLFSTRKRSALLVVRAKPV